MFRLYATPSTWPDWGHNAKWAGADGPLVEGGAVRALVLEARPPLLKVIQTYEVDPTPDGAHIRHAIEISGPLAGPMWLIRANHVYQGWLDKEVAKLIAMARDEPRSGPAQSAAG